MSNPSSKRRKFLCTLTTCLGHPMIYLSSRALRNIYNMVNNKCKKTPLPILTLSIPVVQYSKSTCSFFRADLLDQLKLSFSPLSIFVPTPDLLEWARHPSRHPQQVFGNHSAYQQNREKMSPSTSESKAVPAAPLSFDFSHPFPKPFILWLYHSATSSWEISLSHHVAPFPRGMLPAVVWQSLNLELHQS